MALTLVIAFITENPAVAFLYSMKKLAGEPNSRESSE